MVVPVPVPVPVPKTDPPLLAGAHVPVFIDDVTMTTWAVALLTPRARAAVARPFMVMSKIYVSGVNSDAIDIKYKERYHGNVSSLFSKKTEPKECVWRRLEES